MNDGEEKKNKILDLIIKYKGAIIGGLITLVLVCTGLFEILVAIVIVIVGVIGGNYIQENKEAVKEFLKRFIDRF